MAPKVSDGSLQAGNFVREEILSAFIRLVAHTPELQAYTASKIYSALRSDISQESLSLAATWIIGEYSDVLIETGLIDDEKPKAVSSLHFLLHLLLSDACAGHRRRDHRPHCLYS